MCLWRGSLSLCVGALRNTRFSFHFILFCVCVCASNRSRPRGRGPGPGRRRRNRCCIARGAGRTRPEPGTHAAVDARPLWRRSPRRCGAAGPEHHVLMPGTGDQPRPAPAGLARTRPTSPMCPKARRECLLRNCVAQAHHPPTSRTHSEHSHGIRGSRHSWRFRTSAAPSCGERIHHEGSQDSEHWQAGVRWPCCQSLTWPDRLANLPTPWSRSWEVLMSQLGGRGRALRYSGRVSTPACGTTRHRRRPMTMPPVEAYKSLKIGLSAKGVGRGLGGTSL